MRFLILPRHRTARWLTFIALLLIFGWLVHAPRAFPTGQALEIPPHMTVNDAGAYLKSQHALVSVTVFRTFVHLFNPKNGVLSGAYYFDKPADAITLAYLLTQGEFGSHRVVLTIPEGTNVFQMADIAARVFPGFDKQTFISLAKPEEGYLFPDTYFFLPSTTPQDIIATMRSNFDTKLSSIRPDIDAFGRPLSDVVKMASYLEEEARLTQTRRMVAGILWKRLDMGMPLQIDSAFSYVNGKSTAQLTLDDLKIDSPYNTYVHKGLTPTPISNPGIDALDAAVTPVKSSYFYFLTDRDGNMHYAVTLDEHNANKAKYLP